jgi:hypothetical protein
MKTYTEKQISYTANVISERKCDLCGKVSSNPDPEAWNINSCYDVNETEVSINSGSSFPGGGFGTRRTFDICPECFDKKLIPWMASQGASPQVQESEW